MTQAALDAARRLHGEATEARAPRVMVSRNDVLTLINGFWQAQKADSEVDTRLNAALDQLLAVSSLRAGNSNQRRYTQRHETARS
jgi:hypothetical protein